MRVTVVSLEGFNPSILPVAVYKKLLIAQPLPALTSLLSAAGLKLVDIGGRRSSFPELVTLAPFADYYISEPDSAEAAHLSEHLTRDLSWRSVTVIGEAIGSRRGPGTLYVTRQPGMSSLLEPDPGVTRRFYLGDRFEVVSTTTVPVLPLDDAAERYAFTDACFLKIDTQGTELDILHSGSRLVRHSVVGVYVECSFRPFYKGQPLFSDIDSHLRAHGFELFSLSRANLRRAGYHSTQYSRRITAWAHCLYFREPNTLAPASDTTGRALTQLLGLALAFQHHDLAIETVAAIGATDALDDTRFAALTADVRSCVGRGTRHARHKAREQGVDDQALLGASFRDRKHLE